MEEEQSELKFLNAQRILRAYAQRGDILFGRQVDRFLQEFAAHVLQEAVDPHVRKYVRPGMGWQEIVQLLPDMEPDFVAAKGSILPIKELSYAEITTIVRRDLRGEATEDEINTLCSCYEYLDTWRHILVERRNVSESRVEKWTANLEVERCNYESRKELQSLAWRRLRAETKKKIADERAVSRSLTGRLQEVKHYRQVLTQKLAQRLLDHEITIVVKESTHEGGTTQAAS